MAISDLVVLLPGITGSELVKDGRVVWGVSGGMLARNVLTRGRAVSDDLLAGGLTASRMLPDIHLLPGVWKIDGYGAIADYLRRTLGLVEGENYFPFPYDWTLDNRVAAKILKTKTDAWLRRWRAKSGNDRAKLILCAHSMGGLVSRYFLEVLEGWSDTAALITFGTPYRGSLAALGAISNGANKFGIDLTALVRNLVSVQQLLPIYECVDEGDGRLKRVTEAAVPNLDAQAAKDALAFHHEISDAVAAHRKDERYTANAYKTYPIVGVQQPTHQSARIVPGGVELLNTHLGEDSSGDGTVPRPSAMPAGADRRLAKGMFAATKHASLQNADAVLDFADLRDRRPVYLDLGDYLEAAKQRVQVPVQVRYSSTISTGSETWCASRRRRRGTASRSARRSSTPSRDTRRPFSR